VKRRAAVMVGIGAFTVVLLVVLVTAIRPQPDRAKGLRTLADQFIPPAGASKAFPDTNSTNPPQAVRGWNAHEDTLDQACSAWGNALKMWVGVDHMSGDLTPDVSCSYRADKDGHQVQLNVSVYGTAAPQAVLTVR
jgi:hypothetical protein